MSFKFNPFSGGLDSTNPSGYLGGDLEVTGKLTVTQTISSPTFDSSRVDSTYTTVNSNSASWGTGGSGVNISEVAVASGSWNSAYTTLRSNSADWMNVETVVMNNSGSWGVDNAYDLGVRALTGKYESTFSNVNTNSANWNTAYSNVSSQEVNTNSNVAFNQVTIGANTFFNQPAAGAIGVNLVGGERFRFDYSSGAFRLEGFGTNIAFAPSNTTGPGITRQNLGLGTAAQLSSGAFASSTIYQDLTGGWSSTYSTVNANSASWGTGGSGVNISEVAAASANWNSSYTTVNSTSANWNTAYSKTTTLGSAATANIGVLAEDVAAGNHIHTAYGDIQQAITEDPGTAFSDLAGALGIPNDYIVNGKLTGLDSTGAGTLYAVSAFASSSIYQNLTGNWDSTYTTVNTNSASWGAGGSSINISEVATASGSWNSTNTSVNANSGTWNKATSAAMLRMLISGSAGLTNTTNNTDFLIPFNTLQYMTDSNVISASIVSGNVLIREPGLYHVSVRYASFDMTNTANFMRVQLRSSTSGIISNAAGGTLFRAIDQGAIGTGLNGEATKQGSDLIVITTTPTWLVATALHSGANGGNGNQGYPVNDNSFGNQPQLTIMKVRDL